MNLARIKFISLFICSLCKVQCVCFEKLASGFDESTLRKKLKEYAGQGIIRTEKEGRRVLYSRAPDTDLSRLNDVIDFFSEAAPGVVGSFLQDQRPDTRSCFPSSIIISPRPWTATLWPCCSRPWAAGYITADNLGKHAGEVRTLRLVPLKIYIAPRTDGKNLIAYHEKSNRLNTYRLDYMSNIRMGEVCEKIRRHCAGPCRRRKRICGA